MCLVVSVMFFLLLCLIFLCAILPWKWYKPAWLTGHWLSSNYLLVLLSTPAPIATLLISLALPPSLSLSVSVSVLLSLFQRQCLFLSVSSWDSIYMFAVRQSSSCWLSTFESISALCQSSLIGLLRMDRVSVPRRWMKLTSLRPWKWQRSFRLLPNKDCTGHSRLRRNGIMKVGCVI